MIAFFLFRLLCAAAALFLLCPIIWGLLKISRTQSATLHRIAWGGSLLLSLFVVTVPIQIPIAEKSADVVATPVNSVPKHHEMEPLIAKHDTPNEAMEPVFHAIPSHETEANSNSHEVPITITPKTKPSFSISAWIVQHRLKIVFGVWMLGCLILLGHRVFLHLRLRGLMKTFESIDLESANSWTKLLESYRISPNKIPIYLTDSIGPALVQSGLRKMLLVPRTVWEELSEPLKCSVLRHELAHELHKDTVLSPLFYLLAMIQWFHPLAWFALKKYNTATEWHCDEFAYGENESGSVELTETFLMIHRSTESLGLYLNTFSKFSTLDRIARLVLNETEERERPMKKVFILSVLLLLLCCGIFRPQFVLRAQTPIALKQQTSQDQVAEQPSLETDPLTVPEKMTITVLDENGQPVSGVELFLNIWGEDIETTHREKIKSDEKGNVVFDLTPIRGKKFGPFRLWVSAPGYVSLFRNWDRLTPPYSSIPAELTFAVTKAVTYSGKVVNEAGEPIPGVEMMIEGNGTDQTPPVAPGFGISCWISEDCKTDANGNWNCDCVPDHANIRFGFKHPDYLNIEYGEYKPQEGMSEEKLKAGTALYVMKQGAMVEGTVVDHEGKPLPEVTVRIGSNDMINYWGNKASTTDENGKYKIAWKTGNFPIMAHAQGKAPELKILTVNEKNEPVVFVLQPGKTVKIQIIDQEDKPLHGAYIQPQRWRGTERHFDDKLKKNKKTDENGRWEWNEAPIDSVQFFAYLRGYLSEKDGYLLEPRDEPYLIKMLPAIKATGRVIDAVSKEPIPKFSVFPGYKWVENYREPLLQNSQGKEYQDGTFEFEIEQHNFGYNLRVVAEGYIPSVSETYTMEQGNQTLNVELTAASPVTAVLLLPNGKPAENAKVQLISSVMGMESIWDGELKDRWGGNGNTVQSTKVDGRFTFPAQKEGYVIVAIHDEGIIQAYPEDFADGTLTLKPWARVEGIVKKGKSLWPGCNLMLAAWSDCGKWNKDRPNVQFLYRAASDAEGKFVVEKAIPGREISAFWEEDYARSPLDGFCPSVRGGTVNFMTEPGKTSQIQIGGTGRPVIGKIIDTGKFRDKIDWKFAELNLRGIPADVPKPGYDSLPVPANIDRKNSTLFNEWYNKWASEDESGKQFAELVRAYRAAMPATRASLINEDGTFRVEDVPAGKYEFYVKVFQPKSVDDITPPQGSRLGRDIEGRMSLTTMHDGPIVEVPSFEGKQTDVPADLGKVQVELLP